MFATLTQPGSKRHCLKAFNRYSGRAAISGRAFLQAFLREVSEFSRLKRVVCNPV